MLMPIARLTLSANMALKIGDVVDLTVQFVEKFKEQGSFINMH